ncbi:hypothetical protein ILUMI_07602 [Ignelater luminosus]|uniref:Piezo TM1-24 domain-containing protein n=1 Tax=Ignelater luminosus TaxID=2038154 RepID=A0A8K0GG67_IGNLU|nr:hypothetical protein ILUMI_07602 [Ignelater luminosus]
MANYIMCLSIFRCALPLILVVCIVFRPCLLSAIYLLLLLLLPLIPTPSTQTMAGITGIYLKIVIAISVIALVAQVAFQTVLFCLPPYAYFLENCGELERYLRYAGFIRLNGVSIISATTWLTPEIILCIGSAIVYAILKKLTIEETDAIDNVIRLPKVTSERRLYGLALSIGKYLSLTSLCVAAILRPSVPGGLYFFVFLCATTWWACKKRLRRGFAILLRVLMVVVFFHICALYGYQLQWSQESLPGNSTYARYFGLTPLMRVQCNDPRNFLWVEDEWASYLNPFALILLYYIIAAESKLLLMPQLRKRPSAFSRFEDGYNGPLQRANRLSHRRTVHGTSRQRWQSATRKVRVRIPFIFAPSAHPFLPAIYKLS